MKVTGPTGPTSSSSSSRAGKAAGGFALPSTGAAVSAGPAAQAASASGVAGMSALMALQGVEDATERRRRAIRRGGGLLDRLDELKLALLSGESGAAALEKLSRAVREDRPTDAEPELSALLDQIDLRAAVELAKVEFARARA